MLTNKKYVVSEFDLDKVKGYTKKRLREKLLEAKFVKEDKQFWVLPEGTRSTVKTRIMIGLLWENDLIK